MLSSPPVLTNVAERCDDCAAGGGDADRDGRRFRGGPGTDPDLGSGTDPGNGAVYQDMVRGMPPKDLLLDMNISAVLPGISKSVRCDRVGTMKRWAAKQCLLGTTTCGGQLAIEITAPSQ